MYFEDIEDVNNDNLHYVLYRKNTFQNHIKNGDICLIDTKSLKSAAKNRRKHIL